MSWLLGWIESSSTRGKGEVKGVSVRAHEDHVRLIERRICWAKGNTLTLASLHTEKSAVKYTSFSFMSILP